MKCGKPFAEFSFLLLSFGRLHFPPLLLFFFMDVVTNFYDTFLHYTHFQGSLFVYLGLVDWLPFAPSFFMPSFMILWTLL